MKKYLKIGFIFLGIFIIFTLIIMFVDVNDIGPNNSLVGLSTINKWFSNLIGVNLELYKITDIISVIPIVGGLIFGFVGFIQLIKRKKLFSVDENILILGLYYILLFILFILFIKLPINYRPVLIDGELESSYPSSTTLLSYGFCLACSANMYKYINNIKLRKILHIFNMFIMIFLVVGRIISGVHWLTDIIGSTILSISLFNIYLGLSYKSLFN